MIAQAIKGNLDGTISGGTGDICLGERILFTE